MLEAGRWMMATVAGPPLKTWTRREIDALDEAGLLAGTRFELVEGEVFDKTGQNPPHATAISRLVVILAGIFGLNRIRVQLPVEPAEEDAAHSLPEPDIAVTREPLDAYRNRHSGAGDLLMVCEVADTTYDYDVKRKGRLYARAGFVEYIVLDLTERELLVFGAPRDGVYREMRVLRPGDRFRPLESIESAIAVAGLFGE
jgi:Uma2 family endonuclease